MGFFLVFLLKFQSKIWVSLETFDDLRRLAAVLRLANFCGFFFFFLDNVYTYSAKIIHQHAVELPAGPTADLVATGPGYFPAGCCETRRLFSKKHNSLNLLNSIFLLCLPSIFSQAFLFLFFFWCAVRSHKYVMLRKRA